MTLYRLQVIVVFALGVFLHAHALQFSSENETYSSETVGKVIPPESVVINPKSSSSNATSPMETKLVESTDAMLKLAAPRNLAPHFLRQRPIPTNNWWGNLIAYDVTSTIQPVWANPYTIAMKTAMPPYGMQISYPFATRTLGGHSGNTDAARFYLHSVRNDIMFSATEFANTKPTFQVTDWADMGVTIELSTSAGASMTSQLVSGMAYVTATYLGLVPRLISAAAILTINGKNVNTQSSITGTKLTIAYNSGQTWVVYALNTNGEEATPLTWTVQNSTIYASAPFNGIMRAALVTNSEVDQEKILDKYKHCIVSGAGVNPVDDRSYSIQWNTTGNCEAGLLHYALTHHTVSIDNSSATEVPFFTANSTTRGILRGLVTKTTPPTWTFNEPDSFPIDFYPTTKVDSQVSQQQHMLDHLKADIGSDLKIPVDGSFYFNGKMAQKYASLCLMAKDTAVVGEDTQLLQQCLTKLKQALIPFLTNKWTNKLEYDVVYGGIVSSEGFTKHDVNADFGNTAYNDHHYHYGYWIMTAAIINELDPTWDQLWQLNNMAGLLVRDVATFESHDTYFTKFRTFDWYRGHSYSHGVTAMADGKDEESTSEDINCAYALALYGKVTNNKRLEQIGRLMTKLLARSIQTYFQVQPNSDVHPSGFRPNYVTGIYFDNKVDYATWFSPAKECIHGIQMLPFSPLTPYYRSKTFVSEEWNQVLSKIEAVANDNQKNAWLSILYTNYASVDSAKAMSVLQTVEMDNGLSRSWALYMAATRPQL